MRKAFTLIEIVLVLAILAIVVGLSSVAYRSLQKQTKDIARTSTQRSFLKALDSFRSTGGDVAAILDANKDVSAVAQGQALLNALAEKASATSRESLGKVGELLENVPDMVVIANEADDNSSRLIVDGDTVKIATSGKGFVIVPASDTTEGKSATMASQAAAVVGAEYAQGTASPSYIWNEEGKGISGSNPGEGGTPSVGTPDVTGLGKTTLVIHYADSSSDIDHMAKKFYYSEYVGDAAIKISISRSDNQNISAADVGALTVTFAGLTPTYTTSYVANAYGVTVCQLTFTNLPTSLKKVPTAWSSESYPLFVKADGSSTIQGASRSDDISARKRKLNPPAITSSAGNNGNVLYLKNSGDVIRINSYSTNTSIVPSAAAVETTDYQINTPLATEPSVSGTGTYLVSYTR
jgi:prepilin-type N-terminal cleavage/methylation domain-containing protein